MGDGIGWEGKGGDDEYKGREGREGGEQGAKKQVANITTVIVLERKRLMNKEKE